MNKKLKPEEINRLTVEEFKESKKNPITVVLDNVRSLHNVGAVFRTCDALAIEKLYLCGITPKPPHREIEKTALGSTASVDWSYEKNVLTTVKELKKEGYKIVSIEQTKKSTMLNNFTIAKDEKIALIFGNEVKGVQQEVIDFSDYHIEIPQFGTKHSFNVSVSVGIVLWDLIKQLI